MVAHDFWEVEEGFESHVFHHNFFTKGVDNIVEEIWRKLIYPGIDDAVNRFEISTHGRLRNTKTGYIYKPTVLNSGYCSVRTTLGAEDAKKHIIIHKAVAYTFIPNPNELPEVNHKDGNKRNNAVDNLEWCTSHDNQQHKFDAGLFDRSRISGENNHASKLTWDDVKYIRENCLPGVRGKGMRTMAKKFDVSYPVIKCVVENKTWRDPSYTGP